METTGIEPATSWLQTRERSVVTIADNEVTSSPFASCTPGCTGDETEPHVDPLADLVASLSDEQRRRRKDLLERPGHGPSGGA